MIGSLKEDLMKVLFKVQGYDLNSILEVDNSIYLNCSKKGRIKCPNCGKVCSVYDSKQRDFLISTLFRRCVYLRTDVYRTNCKDCGPLTIPNDIAEGKKRYSRAIGKEIIHFSKHLSNNDISELLGLSHMTIYNIDITELTSLEESYLKRIPELKNITVDEVSYKKRHSYATVISDYDRGKVIWVEKDRKAENLERGYEYLKDKLSNIKCVSMDLWPGYYKATNKLLPTATKIFDRFHISRILNKAIEKERRDYQNFLEPKERKYIKKQTRWILLRRKANQKEHHRFHLNNLKRLNNFLYELYLLKEDFLNIFDAKPNRKQARKEILSWIKSAKKSAYIHLHKFCNTITTRMWDILNYFDYPISNAKAEGINNKIKTVLKRGYGYKNFEYFRLKVLQICGFLMPDNIHTFF